MVMLRRVFILGLVLAQAIHAQDATVVIADVKVSDQLDIISVSPVPDDANRMLPVENSISK